MARTKVWQQSYGQQVTSEGWPPYIVDLDPGLTAGCTLLRTRIDVELLCPTFSDDSLPAAYPWPMLGWQTAIAVFWTDAEPPAGYYSEVFGDWLWVRQQSFDLMPYTLHIDGTPNDQAYLRNTADGRYVDSESRRIATDSSDMFLVVDSIEWGSTDSSQWTPIIQWTSRILVEQPDE